MSYIKFQVSEMTYYYTIRNIKHTELFSIIFEAKIDWNSWPHIGGHFKEASKIITDSDMSIR